MSSPTTLERRGSYSGPPLFSYGFRPFFLAAGMWAAFGLFLWLPDYFGLVTIPTRFAPLDWHIHEMLYGYVPASIAGFLLTAIPNWTGRLPVNGWQLGALAALWLAGRIAIFCSDWIGEWVAAIIDIAFLATLSAIAAREIVAGENWRNLRVLILLFLLIAANIVFHSEVLLTGTANYAIRIAIGAVIMLISLVGGRIVPSFTNNWLARNNPGRLPTSFGRFDGVAMILSAVALFVWIALPGHFLSGCLLVAAGLLHAARLARWAGDRTYGERLVLVLHLAYAFVPIGFVLVGASILIPSIPASAGIHAWTAGAIGGMTVAVMTRATLGHTGQRLHANRATEAVYALVLLSALVRTVAALTGLPSLLEAAGALWILGFALYVVIYSPLLVGRKLPA